MSRSTAIRTVGNGRQTVTTAGTAVALVTPVTQARAVVITAETDNTGVITVGGSGVVGALATRSGTPLSAGQSMSLDAEDALLDLAKVFIDTTVNTDGVTFTYIF